MQVNETLGVLGLSGGELILVAMVFMVMAAGAVIAVVAVVLTSRKSQAAAPGAVPPRIPDAPAQNCPHCGGKL